MTPEFSRKLAVERILRVGLTETVTAEPAERIALAARLGVPALDLLTCAFRLRPAGDAIMAEGTLLARLTQVCIVSLDEFSTDITEEFHLRFVPAGHESDDPDPDAVDEIPITAGVIDLGEAASEQLALVLDPYPRKPDAELDFRADDASTEDLAPNPFAGLARTRRGQ